MAWQSDPELRAARAPSARLRDLNDETRASDLQALITHNIDAYGDDDELE